MAKLGLGTMFTVITDGSGVAPLSGPKPARVLGLLHALIDHTKYWNRGMDGSINRSIDQSVSQSVNRSMRRQQQAQGTWGSDESGQKACRAQGFGCADPHAQRKSLDRGGDKGLRHLQGGGAGGLHHGPHGGQVATQRCDQGLGFRAPAGRWGGRLPPWRPWRAGGRPGRCAPG